MARYPSRKLRKFKHVSFEDAEVMCLMLRNSVKYEYAYVEAPAPGEWLVIAQEVFKQPAKRRVD